MANVLLTNQCNRACKFCFAGEAVARAGGARPADYVRQHMSLADLDRVVEFHKRSALPIISLLGGEPTIHPQFTQIVDRCVAEGLQIRLFSGGLIPPAAKKRIHQLDPARTSLIVNISAPQHCRSRTEYDQTVQSLKDLAAFSTVSYTVFTEQVDPQWLVDLVRETRCRPHIRLGLAMPGPADIVPLLSPDDYGILGTWIVRLAQLCDGSDITIGFDCGFTLCMFTTEQLGALIECSCEPRFLCCPIIDIGPDLSVWSCFGTSTRDQTRLEDFATRPDVVAYYNKVQRPHRSFGVYDRCHTCKHKRRGTCAGGCLAHVLRAFHPVRPPAIAPVAAEMLQMGKGIS